MSRRLFVFRSEVLTECFQNLVCIISMCNGQSDNTVTIFKDKSYECSVPNTCTHSLKLDIEQMGAPSNICYGL